jgi:hypothetical protein
LPRQVEDYLAARIDPSSYWRRVALRYPTMLQFLHDHVRVQVDNNLVIANAVLPSVAAHNLAFASEMLLASPPSAVVVVQSNMPATLEALLAEKMSLRFDQTSLEFAMRDLAADVRDTYPSLPFEFDIKILGDDLEKDSITRNQSVTNFRHENGTVADVLTALVMRCNPITTVKSPAEADQKLVWAIGPDPDQPSREIILITTRDGVTNRDLALPSVFRLPE